MIDLSRTSLIDTEQTVDYNQNNAYLIIRNWLIKKEVKIIDETAPKMITAKHGKRISWKINTDSTEKNITILINETDTGSIVRVILDTPWYNKSPYTIRLMKRKFFDWLSPLWIELGTESEQRLYENLFGAEALYREQLDASKTMYVSLMALLGGIGYFIWSILNGYSDSTIFTVLISLGTVGTIYSWNNVQDAKRKISKLDPEKQALIEPMKAQSNPVKPYKYLTLVVLIFIIGFGVWAYKQPNVLTYHGDGYAFEYPRYFTAALHHEEDIPEDRFEYVQCEYEGQLIIVYVVSRPESVDPEELLESVISGYDDTFDVVVVNRDIRELDVRTIHEGELNLNYEEKKYSCMMGSFYVEEQDRIYLILCSTDGSSAEKRYLNTLNSFTIS